MKRLRTKYYFLLLLLLLIPLGFWLWWYYTPQKVYHVILIDKTVLDSQAQEHQSVNWILKHERFTNSRKEPYEISSQYYGFHPKRGKKFFLRDFSGWTQARIDSLADISDMIYATDTYGIYTEEWKAKRVLGNYSPLIYGGMSMEEFNLLKAMKDRDKLVLLEFNTFAQPTKQAVRNKLQQEFGLFWTGWTGRYFESLDSLQNRDLPKWAFRLYTSQYKKPWKFTNSGIVLIHSSERIVVLENNTHLIKEVPFIETRQWAREKYHLPKEVAYPFWFDITFPTDQSIKTFASYRIHTNAAGDSLLHRFQIPTTFPAVMTSSPLRPFYYFCGDFADNINPQILASFKHSDTFLRPFFRNNSPSTTRQSFFWNYYNPMMKVILNSDWNTRIAKGE